MAGLDSLNVHKAARLFYDTLLATDCISPYHRGFVRILPIWIGSRRAASSVQMM